MSFLIVEDLIEGFDGRGEVGEVAPRRLCETFGAEGRDCERRVRTLKRLKCAGRRSSVVFRPECEHPVEGVVEPVALLGGRYAESFEHRLLEAAPESNQKPAPRDLIEGGDFRGDFFRWVER